MRCTIVMCLVAIVYMSPSIAMSTPLGDLDQEHIVPDGFAVPVTGPAMAQTFVAGADGRLSGVELQIFQTNVSGPRMAIVDILGTLSGVPVAGDILASVVVDISCCSSTVPTSLIVAAEFSSTNLLVENGDWLAIAVSPYPGGGSISWQGGSRQRGSANYLQGAGFNLSGDTWVESTAQFGIDYEFRTYVQPIPEPSTALLMGLGLVVLGAGRRAYRETPECVS